MNIVKIFKRLERWLQVIQHRVVVLIIVRGYREGDSHIQIRIGYLLQPGWQCVGVRLWIIQCVEGGRIRRSGACGAAGSGRSCTLWAWCSRSGACGRGGCGGSSRYCGCPSCGWDRRRNGCDCGAWSGRSGSGGAVVHIAAIATWESARIAWRGGAHMCIGAMNFRSITLQQHHRHLSRRQWCWRHRRQWLATAEADTYIVAARLLHTHHMLRGSLLGYDLWLCGHFGAALNWWQQIPGDDT